MDPATVEAAITPRTKAIMPVHLYGQCADMDPILAIARKHKLLVIEDAAQAHGAEYKGQRAGSMGDMGCFSFYPGKNLGAYGEGGMVVTGDAEYARKIRMLRDWGAEKKYQHVLKGYNFRLEGIQGAVLRVKLRHLEAWTEARRAAAARYDRGLEAAACQHRRRCPITGTSITSMRSVPPPAGMDGCVGCTRDPDRYSLPDPGAPAAGLRGSWLPGRTVPALGTGGKRGAFAADVPGVDG